MDELWTAEIFLQRYRYKKALLDIVCLGEGNLNKVFIRQFNHAAIQIAKEALEDVCPHGYQDSDQCPDCCH